MANLLLQLGAVVTVLAAPFLHLVVASAEPPEDVALVVGGFGRTAAEVIGAAGLAEVGVDRAPLGAFAQIEHPDDVEKLRQAGAVFVLDGNRVLDLCS